MMEKISRRAVLKGAGVTIALPWLEAMGGSALAQGAASGGAGNVKRLVLGNFGLGWNPESFFPKETGSGYTLSPTLKKIADLKDDFTIIQGLTHGYGGHANEGGIFTGVTPAGGNKVFSIDQYVAETWGKETRFGSLQVGASPNAHSYNRSGVPLRHEADAEVLFTRLFGKTDQKARKGNLDSNESILDQVMDQANAMQKRLGKKDQEKLEEYLYSIRALEEKIQRDRMWMDKPKPEVDKPYKSPPNSKNYFERMGPLYDIMKLALQTDSTRVIEFGHFHQNIVDLEGLSDGYHNLSHHGNDPNKLEDLLKIEAKNMEEFAKFLKTLKDTEVDGKSMLDDTIVMITSNLGNASNHTGSNLPVLLAGGGFKSHGSHFKKEPVDSTLMSNLFVTLLNQMGFEDEKWGPSTGSLSEIA